MLHISENTSGYTAQAVQMTLAHAKDETRKSVARELGRLFPSHLYYIHVGGHHVAVHCFNEGVVAPRRILMITGTSPDFSDKPEPPAPQPKPQHPRTFVMRSISSDLHKRAKLCQMIATSRELRIVNFIAEGYPMVDNPDHWKTLMDSNVGSRYSFVISGGRRRFAIEHETGNIYWVSKGGHVNRNKHFGSLDTIEDWYWGWIEPKLRIRY